MSEHHRNWQLQPASGVMTKRFEFANYAATRAFLDRLTRLSVSSGYFPSLNFSSTYVMVSVAAQGEALGPSEYAFAGQVDDIAEPDAADATPERPLATARPTTQREVTPS